MTDNQQLVLNYIKAWSKGHETACRLSILKNALTVQMSDDTLQESLKTLVKDGYLRSNVEGNTRSYTMLRS